jgi:transcriptional regulator with XRE-family HTH domain
MKSTRAPVSMTSDRSRKIKAEMALKGYTETDLARELNMHRNTVSNRLIKDNWRLQELEHLATIFGKPVEFFLT